MILWIQEILPFIDKLNFIYSFKNPVLDSGKIEEKIKILRWETLDLNLLEEMVELVWYIKNCMAHLQVKLEFLCEVFSDLCLSSFEICAQNESL